MRPQFYFTNYQDSCQSSLPLCINMFKIDVPVKKGEAINTYQGAHFLVKL